MTAWIAPSRTPSETPSQAWTPPKYFETSCASSSSASPMMIRRDRRRLRPVRLVGFVRERCGAEACEDRHQNAAREAEHACDEQRAEENLPVGGDGRDEVAPDDVDDRADQRPPDRPRPAEDRGQD